jgi:uncharacterized SAM-binding protein YcdF (DUF218 family)
MSYTEPLLSVIFILGLIGALRLPKSRGKKLVLASLLALLMVAWPPMQWLLSRPLEGWYPIQPLPPASADAIVVLSSGVDTPHYERPFALALQDTYTRCRFAAWLYQQWKALPILACGGGVPAFSASMREVLTSVGVPDSSIWIEDRSRSTYENALYGADVLRSHGINRVVLVVDAQSMVRASACFRKQGIAVIPAPSDFTQCGFRLEDTFLSWKAVRGNEITLHEIFGLAWYKMRGWI